MLCMGAMIEVSGVNSWFRNDTYPNALIEFHFLVIVIVSIKGIEADALVCKFRPNL
jgi:hypothetical protein